MMSVVDIPVRLTRLGQKEISMFILRHKLRINRTVNGRKFTFYVEQRGNLLLQIEGMKTWYFLPMINIAETIINLRKKKK